MDLQTGRYWIDLQPIRVAKRVTLQVWIGDASLSVIISNPPHIRLMVSIGKSQTKMEENLSEWEVEQTYCTCQCKWNMSLQIRMVPRPQVTLNVCTTFQINPSSSWSDISVWTKMVDWPTNWPDTAIHRAMLLNPNAGNGVTIEFTIFSFCNGINYVSIYCFYASQASVLSSQQMTQKTEK